MAARDAAPDDADLGAIDLLAGPVDVRDALAQIEFRVLSALDVLDLKERGVFPLIALGALEAQDAALDVQTRLNCR